MVARVTCPHCNHLLVNHAATDRVPIQENRVGRVGRYLCRDCEDCEREAK